MSITFTLFYTLKILDFQLYSINCLLYLKYMKYYNLLVSILKKKKKISDLTNIIINFRWSVYYI